MSAMGRGSKLAGLTNRLRILRIEAGLSQAELAERCGITRQAVSSIEGGRYAPSTAVALAIARAVGRSVEDVFQLAASRSDSGPATVADTTSVRGPIVAGRVGERIVPWSLAGDRSLVEG